MQVDREEFSVVLARLKPALSSGGTIAALSHVWFDTTAAYAFDGGFGMRLKIDTELDCGVPGVPLMGLLATSKLKEADLEPNGASMKVKLGKSTSKLAILETTSKVWPFPAKLSKKNTPAVLDENFIEALRKVLFVKASSPSRVEHYGVTIQKRKKDLLLCTTDTATLAATVVKGAGAAVEFEKTLLPRDFAEQLVAQAPEGANLYVLPDCLIAVAEDVTFYSNVLDLEAADDLDAIVLSQLKAHPEPVPLPAGLEAALNRAEILAGREEPVVTLSVETDGLKLFGDYALGQLNETLELEGELPKATFKIKAGIFRRALPYAENLSITKNTLLMRSSEGFVYVVSSL